MANSLLVNGCGYGYGVHGSHGYGVPVIKNDKSAVNFWAYKILSIIGKRLE